MEKNWFSNFIFYKVPLKIGRLTYLSPEHYYQAQKTTNDTIKELICRCPSAKKAKKLGGRIKEEHFRKGWDNIRLSVMEIALVHRLETNENWKEQLLNTGDETIVEVNYWHDNYWGNCTCAKCTNIIGENNLGKILMSLREKYK